MMRQRTENSTGSSQHERGVSDIIGFTLMFSVIILGVGMVSVTGYTQLEQLSDSQDVESAERGMVSVAATLEDINRQGANNRTFKLAISDSTVWVQESELHITLDGNTALNGLTIHSLEHRFSRSPEDITVRYEGGAVFRSDGGSPRYEPTFKCNDAGGEKTAIINVVNFELGSIIEGAALGSGYNSDLDLSEYSIPDEAPVRNFDRGLTFNASLVGVDRNFTTGNDMTITVDFGDTADPTSWGQYFEDSGWEDVSSRQNTYECDGVDRQLVRVTTILLQLEDAQSGVTDNP